MPSTKPTADDQDRARMRVQLAIKDDHIRELMQARDRLVAAIGRFTAENGAVRHAAQVAQEAQAVEIARLRAQLRALASKARKADRARRAHRR